MYSFKRFLGIWYFTLQSSSISKCGLQGSVNIVVSCSDIFQLIDIVKGMNIIDTQCINLGSFKNDI